MADEISRVITRFEGDTRNLEAASKRSQTAVNKVAGPTKALAATTQRAGQQITQTFEKVGTSAGAIGTLIGGVQGQIFALAGTALTFGKAFIEAAAPIALFVGGLALIAKVVAEVTKSIQENERATRSATLAQRDFAEESKANAAILSTLVTRVEDYDTSYQRIIKRNELFGQTQATVNQQIAQTEDLLVDLQLAADKLNVVGAVLSREDRDRLERLNSVLIPTITARLEVLREKQAEFGREAERSAQTGVDGLEEYSEEIKRTEAELEALGQKVSNTGDIVAANIAQTLSQVLVYGRTVADTLVGVFQAIASAAIALVTRILFEVVAAAITKIIVESVAAYANIPFVGIAVGLAVAAGAIAAARSLASSEGGAAFAEGGIALRPIIGLVGEAGPEAIIPLNRLGEMSGQGEQRIQVMLNERILTDAVVRGMPSRIRLQGVKGL